MAASSSGAKSKDAQNGAWISAPKSSVTVSTPGNAARPSTKALFRERNASASQDWASNSEKSAVLTTKVRPDVPVGWLFGRLDSPLRQTLSGSRPPLARNRSTLKCSPAARRTQGMASNVHQPGNRAMTSSLRLPRQRVNTPMAHAAGNDGRSASCFARLAVNGSACEATGRASRRSYRKRINQLRSLPVSDSPHHPPCTPHRPRCGSRHTV